MNPIIVAPTIGPRRDVDIAFTDYHEHLSLEDVRSVPSPRAWSIMYGYTNFFIECPILI